MSRNEKMPHVTWCHIKVPICLFARGALRMYSVFDCDAVAEPSSATWRFSPVRRRKIGVGKAGCARRRKRLRGVQGHLQTHPGPHLEKRLPRLRGRHIRRHPGRRRLLHTYLDHTSPICYCEQTLLYQSRYFLSSYCFYIDSQIINMLCCAALGSSIGFILLLQFVFSPFLQKLLPSHPIVGGGLVSDKHDFLCHCFMLTPKTLSEELRTIVRDPTHLVTIFFNMDF